MKKKRRRSTQEKYEVVRLWTYKQAQAALPYLRSVGTSLRENWLNAQGKSRQIERLSKKVGRPDKAAILELENLQTDQRQAEAKFRESLEEMLAMHVFPIDVNQGLALIPFREKEELAWFVFDLFEPQGMQSWRFHNDPLEKRRPITESQGETTQKIAM